MLLAALAAQVSPAAGVDVVVPAGVDRSASPAPTPDGAVTITLATLATGSCVEVTSLDSGRTIVVLVAGGGRAGEAGLSPRAATLLKLGERAPVRVREAVVDQADRAALLAGGLASPRLDAPPALLAALRRRLPTGQPASPPRLDVPASIFDARPAPR